MTWEQIRFRWHVARGLYELGRIQTDDFHAEPPKSAFDGISLRDLSLMYSVGRKTILEVELWLGRRITEPPKLSAEVLRSIAILERHGYTVISPIAHVQTPPSTDAARPVRGTAPQP